MFYLIVFVFLLAGALPFVGEFQARHDPALAPLYQLAKPSLLTLDNAIGLLLIVIAVGLLFRRGWARTLGVAILLAWLVKYGLLIVVGLLFMEMLGVYTIMGLLLAGRLAGSLGQPGAAAATREGMGGILSVLAHPILSRLVILVAGATVVLLLHWVYRYLRDDEAVEWDFGPLTLFGRGLNLRGRDLTVHALAAAYLMLPFLPMLGQIPALRALSPESRRAAAYKKKAEEREKKNWITNLAWSADLTSMLAFTAIKGAVRVDLESGRMQALDPEVFSYAHVAAPAYAGRGQGYPEKLHSRVSPDHEWFLNQQEEIVSIREGTRRRVQTGRPLGRPVLFLDAKQLVTLTPEGEFLWVELDPDRVTYVASAPGGQGGELQNQVPLMEVSGPRNALYYEVGGSHYLYDLEAAEGFHVGTGDDTQFQAFTSEGDRVCLRVRSEPGRRDELVLVDVKTGARTVVPWSGSIVHLSTANNLAVVKDQRGVLHGYALTAPENEVWQAPAADPDPVHLESTPDASTLLGAPIGKGELLWSRLYPLTGPEAWQTLSLGAAPGKGEFPTFDIDPTSQIAAWRFGLKAEVFRIADLAAGTRPRRYDLEDAW